MWGTAIGLLGFLFKNSDALVAAGKAVGPLVGEVIGLINGAAAEGRTDLTRDEFNAFVDKALGDSTHLAQIIADLKAEILAG